MRGFFPRGLSMKLHQSKLANLNQFTGYGEGYVMVNQERFEGSVLVAADRVEPWSGQRLETLGNADFEPLLALAPEVVLIGTGSKLRFAHPSVYSALLQARIGVDFMDNGALCRTFNILCAEERRVIAVIMHDQ